MNTQQSNEAQVLKEQAIELLMIQAQVYASSWYLIGTRFDKGWTLADAETEKQRLRSMLGEILDVHMGMLEMHKNATKQLAEWIAGIAQARIKREDVLPIIDKFIQEHVKVMPPTDPSVH